MMPGIENIQGQNDRILEDIDFEEVEYKRQLLRPAEIKEDVNLLEQRHRVSGVLHSEEFNMALNQILDHHLQEGEVCGGLAGSANEYNTTETIKSIYNFILPQAQLGSSVFNRGLKMPIIPVNDLRSKNGNMTKQEKFLRCKLASVYRLIDLHGWASGMMLHASTRILREENIFLVNCYGLMNHEVTASNLLRINIDGDTEDSQSLIDHRSWLLHAAIHNADPLMRCVVFIKTPSVIAVSCMRSGLVAVCDEAVRLGNVPMYEWGSATAEMGGSICLAAEQEALRHTIGHSSCLLVRSRGLLVRGKTVEDAWRIAELAVQACEIQVRLASVVGSTNTLIAEESGYSNPVYDQEADLSFEALMRALDSAGYQTGYLYRHVPITEDQHTKAEQSTKDMGDEDYDVEIPPSATSFSGRMSNSGDEGTQRRDAPIKWHIHTTNDYVRQETDGPGRRNGRKMVSWSQVSPDKRQSNGAVEVSTCANQFAPQGRDPHEFRHQQQKIKAKYFYDETTAGHQSRILRSLESTDAITMATGEEGEGDRVVLVGAVSQGIIDKQHRQDPSVYQTSFSANPFNRVTDNDLQQYHQRIDRFAHGLPLDTEDHGQQKEKKCVILVTSVDNMSESHVTTAGDGDHDSDRLCPSRIDTLRSDTSDANISHDDTEREGLWPGSTDPTKKKKKRKLRAIFSFRKDKSK